MSILELYKNYGRCCKAAMGPMKLLPLIICKDGQSLSCQVGYGYHSIQSEDNEEIYAFEVRTSCGDKILQSYKNEACSSQYDFVHIEVVDEVIKNHGGIDLEAIEKYIEEHK